jgi:hypothetical protein
LQIPKKGQSKSKELQDLVKPIKSNLISTELINQILKKPIPNLLHIETRGKKKDFKSMNSEITVPKAKDFL